MAGSLKVSQNKDIPFCISMSLEDVNCNFNINRENQDIKKNIPEKMVVKNFGKLFLNGDSQDIQKSICEKLFVDNFGKSCLNGESQDLQKNISEKFIVNNLRKLCLNGLGLDEVNFNFQLLLNVTEIDLSQNKLTSLPESIINCKKVTSLNLSMNHFPAPPSCIYFGFHFLKELDLSFNELNQFHMAPLCLPFLLTLNLKYNFLRCPPPWLQLDLPCSLEHLDLSFNPCFSSKLSEDFFKFSEDSVMANVRTLKLSNTGLSGVNFDFIRNFVNLSCLDIGNSTVKLRNCKEEWNSIQELNEDVLFQLPLEELNAVDCNIPDLPKNIDKMIHLKVLNVSQNKMLWMPENLSKLHSLVIFEASKCNLVLLPNEIGLLVSLQQLWLSSNDLSSLPESIQSLTSLEILDLYDNSFTSLPNVSDFPNLKGFDICLNICDPADFKMNNNNSYKMLQEYLRSCVKSEVRQNNIKIINYNYESDNESKFESESSSNISCPSPFHRSRRGSRDSYDDFVDEEEIWDLQVDENETFDPNNYMAQSLTKSHSSDSLFKLKKNLADQEEHYFCPFKQVSNFHESVLQDSREEDEEGQFNDD